MGGGGGGRGGEGEGKGWGGEGDSRRKEVVEVVVEQENPLAASVSSVSQTLGWSLPICEVYPCTKVQFFF